MSRDEIRCRKVAVRRFGPPEALEVIPTVVPAPPPGHIRVRVLAIGVGMTDLVARSGEYLLQRRLPFTPGYELIGEIDTVGDDVDDSGDSPLPAAGTRVAMVLPRMGAYSECVVVPSWLPVPLPDGLDPHLAATVPLDYLTALSLLERHAGVRDGDTVLIHGAAGGVGQALSQLGRLKRLRMYGTASAPTPLARHGVRFIDYRHQDFETVLREQEPGGVHAVFDHIGGANLAKGYRLLAPGGTLVSHAFMGRPGHRVADTVRGAVNLRLRGLLPGRRTALCMIPRELRTDPAWYRRSLQRLLDLAHARRIQPGIGAVADLADATAIHRALERREIIGKAVLTASGAR
jgi:NADPH:quinone reductase-like Zn-dependent oxidoreductase